VSADLFQQPSFEPSSATFSDCKAYRFTLWRRWGTGPFCMFIGLNPSTADATKDDPTIRRCVGFAKQWGFDALLMANLFAFRATDPADMKAHEEGTQAVMWNLTDMRFHAERAGLVVAAWGAHGHHCTRDRTVQWLMEKSGVKLTCLGLTADGSPRHPLYMPKTSQPLPFSPTPTPTP
jgi:hypothetical protein